METGLKINPETLQEYQKRLAAQFKERPASLNRKLSSLRQFTKWAGNEGYLVDTPQSRSPRHLGKVIVLAIVVLTIFGLSRFITISKLPVLKVTEPQTVIAGSSLWIIRFQGKLSSTNGQPIQESAKVVFKLYKEEKDGPPLWTSKTWPLEPNPQGEFVAPLGDTTRGDYELPSNYFFQEKKLFLGVEVDGQEVPERMRVSTADAAANSYLLQNYPPGLEAGPLTIPVINEDGALVLAAQNPSIKAVSGTLGISADSLSLFTPDASDGSITLNPDGKGVVNLLFEGKAPIGDDGFLNAKNANQTSGALIYGEVANNATGYRLIELVSGSTPATRFSVDASGNTFVSGKLTAGSADLKNNLNLISGDLKTGNVTRLTNAGRLSSITGYYQDSGEFRIDQGAPDVAKITKSGVTASADSLTATLDETNQTASNYDTLVLKRLGGGTSAYALYLAAGNAFFEGTLEVKKGLTANENLDVKGDTTLGDATTDKVTFNARIASFLVPSTTSTYDLGSSSLYWNALYANNVYGTTTGTQGYWQRNSQAISPTNITDDLLLGATATSSALVKLTGTSGNNSWINTGNFGIGTTNPAYKLEVNGSLGVGGTAWFGSNVGIGTTAPGATLDVVGDLKIGTLASGATNTVLTHSSGVVQTRSIDSRVWGTSLVDYSGTGNANYLAKFSDDDTILKSILYETGSQIGIGKTNPGYTVDINGSLGVGSTAYFGSNVGIGTSNPGAALDVNGDVILGSTSAHTITPNGVISGSFIPDGQSTRSVGSSSIRWPNGYFTTLDATSLVGTVVTGSTTASTWTINSDNLTSNAEIAAVAFETGGATFNAVLQWNASGDVSKILGFDNYNLFNYPVAIFSQVSGGNQTFTSGSLFKYSQPSTHAITQSGAFIGTDLDFSSNITVPDSSSGNQTGAKVTLKDGGASATSIGFQTAGTLDYGLDIGGTVNTAEIRLSNGETISNTTDGTIALNPTTFTLSGTTTLTASSLATIDSAASLTIDATSLTLGGSANIYGGTAASGTLTLVSTSDATKGNIQFFSSSNTLDSSGNLTLAGDADIKGGDIRNTTGALTITPNAGTNLNISLSTTGDFAVNTNQLYVDTSASSVGIGLTNPAYKLEVNGSLGVGSTAYFASNVGIGTTAPAAHLEISKSTPELRLTDTTSNEYTRVNKANTSNKMSFFNRVTVPGTTTTLDYQVGGVTGSTDDANWQTGDFGVTYNLLVAYLFGSTVYNNGMRWTSITIPAGATITASYITVTANSDSRNSTTQVYTKIDAHDVASPTTFSTKADYDARARTTAKVDWDITSAWTTDTEYNSPSLNSIIQELVDSYNYASGAPIVLFMENDSMPNGNGRGYYGYDESSPKAPKLHIEYTPAGTTQEVTVATSEDGGTGGEYGIQTFGDSSGRTVLQGATQRFFIGSSEKMRLDASGNLGIGTTGPANRLEVLSTTTPQLRIAYDGTAYFTTAVAGTTGAVTFDTNGTTPSFTFSDAVTANTFSSSGVTITGGSITGTTIGASSASTGAFTTLTSSGNTTLGTGVSGAHTYSTGAGSTTTLGNSTGALTLASGGTSAWTNTSGNLTISTATSGILNLTSGLAAGQTTNSAFNFTSSNDLGVADELLQIGDSAGTFMTVLGNGNVGIGTTSPNNRLEVLSTTTPQLRIAYDGTAYFTTAVAGTTGAVTFDANGTVPSFSFSDAVTANTFSSSGVTITGGSITGTTIGSSNPGTGAFTTLTSSGNTTLGTGISGAHTYSTGAGSTTTLGNSTGALTLASGGTSAWTNTSGNLTISTATSGTLALDSAGALNIGPTNATSLGIGRSGVTTTVNGTVNLAGGTASRFVVTDTSNNLVYSAASSVLSNTLTDETGTGGVAVFSTSPQITTSLTTDSTTFALLNTTATTINFGGGATTALNIGNGNTAYTAINLGSGTGGNTINIAGTGATGADTINIGTGGTSADIIHLGDGATANTITIGNAAATTVSITDDNWSITAAGAAKFVSIGATTAGSGAFTTLTSSGNTTLGTGVSGVHTYSTGAGSTTTLGNSTGALTLASGGTSAWTNTSGNLTISTATSGTLALTSAGVLNLTSALAAGGTTNSAFNITTSTDLGVADELLQIGDSAGTFMTVLGSGNVGIGTANPVRKLSVVGTSYGSLIARNIEDSGSATTSINTSSSYLQLGGGEYGTVNNYRLMTFGYWNTGLTYSPAYMGYVETGWSGNTYGDLIFGTRSVATDTQPSERLRITSGGYVGIGTTSPNETLEVASTTARSIVSDGGGANRRGLLLIGPTATTDYGRIEAYGYGTSGGGKNLIINNVGGGYVGIGTTGPANRLEVLSTTTPQLRVAYDGTAYFTTAVAGTTGAVTFDTNGTVPSFTFSDAVTANTFASSGVTITGGSITGTTIGASNPTTGAFTTLSSTGVTTLGNNTATVAIDSSDWNINTTGDMTGIGSIGMDGNLTITKASPVITLNSTDGAAVINGVSTQQLHLGPNSTYSGLYIAHYSTGTVYLGGVSATTYPGAINYNAGGHYFQIGTSEKMRINSSGNVGIGTAGPVAADSSAKTLQIGNNLIFQNVIGTQTMYSNNAYYDGAWKRATAATAQAIRLVQAANTISFHIAPTGAADSAITNWDGSDIKMIIDSSGQVGIGTAAPGAKLEVTGNILLSQGADRQISVGDKASLGTGGKLSIKAGNGNDSGGGVLQLTGGDAAISGSGGSVYIYGGSSIGGGGGNVVLGYSGGVIGNVYVGIDTQYSQRLCHSGSDGAAGQNVILGDCLTGGADLAEYYGTEKDSEPGDVVSIHPDKNLATTKSSTPYDQKLLGVISTEPYEVMGNTIPQEDNPQPIALIGRTSVKVSTENGPIAIGDPLTSSSTPGVAMRATKAGAIVGKALESSEQCNNVTMEQCKIMAFVNISWYDPDVYLTSAGELNIVNREAGSMNHDSSFIIHNSAGEIIRRIGAFAELAVANLKAGLIETQELVAEKKIVSPLIETEQLVAKESLFGKLLVQNEQGETVASIDNAGNASFAGTLNAQDVYTEGLQARSASIAGTLYADEIITKKGTFGELLAATVSAQILTQADLEEIKTKLAELETTLTGSNPVTPALSEAEGLTPTPLPTPASVETPTATESGLLAEATSWEIADVSQDLRITSNLKVLGRTSLAATTVAGTFSQDGSLIIDQGNSINVTTGTLYLQNLGFGGVDILAGKMVIDLNGNVQIAGNLAVGGELTAQRILLGKGVSLPEESGFGKLLEIQNPLGEIVASIDASGSASFAQVETKKIVIASAQFPIPNSQFPITEIQTNATAGEAILPAGVTEITINSQFVTENTLVYVTPLTSTQNQVLYIKAKQAHSTSSGQTGWFKVGIDTPIERDIKFNWWVIN